MDDFRKNIRLSSVFAFSIFLFSLLLYLNLSYMGVSDKNIESVILKNFMTTIISCTLKILLVYLLLGILIGFFSILLKIRKTRNILLFNIFFWLIFWIRGIKLFPQLYKGELYLKGTFLKYFQMFITDYIPLFMIYLLFVLVILAISIKNKRIPFFFVIILFSLFFIVKFKESPVKSKNNIKPNVLIFATDSLRPKSISYNGYFRKTPNIDKLFSKGVNFLNTKVSLARTLSSWTSVLTSTLPPNHKIRHMFPTKRKLKSSIKIKNIVSVLNKNNYSTSVVSDFAGDIFARVDYGFKKVKAPHLAVQNFIKGASLEIHYFLLGFLLNRTGRTVFPEMWGMPLYEDPCYVTEYTKKYIKKSIKENKPFFVLAFSSNNHFPYSTKYPYYNFYTDKKYFKAHKYCKDDMMKTYSGYYVPEDDKKQIIGLYDNATKLFDDNLGEILKFIKKCNVDKNTIVIIMSDHGENLYEDGYGAGHGDHLRGEYSNSMTFGIYNPFESYNGLRVSKTVREIDIAPTLLDLIGIDIPKTFEGKSLLPVMRGEKFEGYPVYMETGLWYSTSTPYINDRIRIYYPGIKEILDFDRGTGDIIIKNKYEKKVIGAKYRAFQINENKYIYMPGNGKFKEEYYINEKLINKDDIKDKDFLNYKQKMVDMFRYKLYIDSNGFVREYGVN